MLIVGLGAAWAAGAFSASSSGPASAATLHTVLHSQYTANVAFADGSGWVLDDNAGTIRRFDPSSGRFTDPARHIGRRPVSMAVGNGRLWVADAVANDVVAFDPATGKVTGEPIAVTDEPVSVAVGDGGVWVASINPNGIGTVSLIDPMTSKVVATVAPADGAVRVAVGPGAVWVTGLTDTVAKIDPTPHGATLSYQAITVDTVPIGVTVSGNRVYVANSASGTVSIIDAATGVVIRTVELGSGGRVLQVAPGVGTTTTSSPTAEPPSSPEQVVVFDGRLWVADGFTATLSALDPVTGKAVGTPVHLPGVPRQLLVSGGELWATTANLGTVVRVTPN